MTVTIQKDRPETQPLLCPNNEAEVSFRASHRNISEDLRVFEQQIEESRDSHNHTHLSLNESETITLIVNIGKLKWRHDCLLEKCRESHLYLYFKTKSHIFVDYLKELRSHLAFLRGKVTRS